MTQSVIHSHYNEKLANLTVERIQTSTSTQLVLLNARKEMFNCVHSSTRLVRISDKFPRSRLLGWPQNN